VSLGAAYDLDGSYDSGLAQLQAQLVRTGFLDRVTGRWSWDTYAAIGYADRYLQSVATNVAVHSATNTITVDDAWITALGKAPPAPAGTVGLWRSIPHRSVWPARLAVGVGAAVLLGVGVWLYRRRR